MLEVNFLAVHQKVRAKRLAQIVIQEMMRRKRLFGFPQAFYTSGHSMPTPFTTCHYMNRFINGETLVLTKYTNCPADMSLKEFDRKYRLPKKETIKLVGKVRPMEKRDVPTVFKLFRDQQAKYKIQYKYNQDEIIHHLLPKEDIVWTYVVEDIFEGKKVVTDFFSMYRLTQTCTNADVIALGYT
jgi:glycylpeptide N-tetradecanoyltransferase